MPWLFRYTEHFIHRAKSLRHEYQKIQITERLKSIKELDNPKDSGGPYMGGWAYFFGRNCLIQCDINENENMVIFTNIVL